MACVYVWNGKSFLLEDASKVVSLAPSSQSDDSELLQFKSVKSRRRPLSFDPTCIPTTPQKLPLLLCCFDADRVTCKSIINNARWRCQFIHRFFRREEDFVGKFFPLFSVADTIRGPKTISMTLRIFLSICLS